MGLATAKSAGWQIGWLIRGFNGPMVRARKARGVTQAFLADVVGVSVPTISAIESLRTRPRPDLRDSIAEFLRLSPEQVWPDWLEPREQSLSVVAYQDVDQKTYSMLDPAVKKELLALPAPTERPAQEQLRATLDSIMGKRLTRREHEILRMRFGLNDAQTTYTLEECGRVFRLSKERVRGIEMTALRKLSSGSAAGPMREVASDAGFYFCEHCSHPLGRTVFCADCGRQGCGSCFDRIHRGKSYVYACEQCQMNKRGKPTDSEAG